VTIFQIFELEIVSWICLAASIALMLKGISSLRLRRLARGFSSMSRSFQRFLQLVAIVPPWVRHRGFCAQGQIFGLLIWFGTILVRLEGAARAVLSAVYRLTYRHVMPLSYFNFLQAGVIVRPDLARGPSKLVLARAWLSGANMGGNEAICSGSTTIELTSRVATMTAHRMHSIRSGHSGCWIVAPALAKLPIFDGGFDVSGDRQRSATGAWRDGNNLLALQAPRAERILLRALPTNVAIRSASTV
jgi:hypothetical protein